MQGIAPPAGVAWFTSRPLTIAVALHLSVTLLPVMLIIALGLLVTGTRRVLYRVQRVGRGGRLFTMYKFRSMGLCPQRAGHDAAGGPYLRATTPFGRFLRRTGLDELPQLWNVLKGDLDLVGVRPALPEHVANHPEIYIAFLSSRPGLGQPRLPPP